MTGVGAVGTSAGHRVGLVGQSFARLRHACEHIRWLPRRERAAIDQYAFHGRPLSLVLVVGLLIVPGTHPVVVRATGIGPEVLLGIWAILATWVLASHQLLYRRALRSPAAFHALVFGNMAIGALVCLAFPVLSRSPQTPYWVTIVVAACGSGAADGNVALLPGLFHVLVPFTTIPVFLARGASTSQATTGPLIASAASGFGYFLLARRGQLWRSEREERELHQTQERLEESERERRRLARDLHDSVGTALSLVSMYSVLVEQNVGTVDEARHLASTIRESARQGLDELRGVLQALPQAPATLDELASGLRLVGHRSAQALGARLDVRVSEGASVSVDGLTRSTVVRVFHESVHNALRHGSAREIRVDLRATADSVRMEIQDDGTGRLPAEATGGCGLSNIRQRAIELGGTAEIRARPGTGTRISVNLPVRTGA
jgi:signal transduction histidine kinase